MLKFKIGTGDAQRSLVALRETARAMIKGSHFWAKNCRHWSRVTENIKKLDAKQIGTNGIEDNPCSSDFNRRNKHGTYMKVDRSKEERNIVSQHPRHPNGPGRKP